jgi:hypothetical protein
VNKIIEIIVSPTGQTTVQTKGFSGANCQEASRFIEQALGRRSNEQLTGEFYEVEGTRQVSQEASS